MCFAVFPVHSHHIGLGVTAVTGEKLEAVKKQLKVQRKQQKAKASAGPAKEKVKSKGIRLRKGVRVKVLLSHTAHPMPSLFHYCAVSCLQCAQ